MTNAPHHTEATQTAAASLRTESELAHAAKLNLDTTWGVGESGIPGPDAHRRTGLPAGMGFVAIAGPTAETTGVLKISASNATRGENMARFAQGALDLFGHLQTKQQ